MTSADVLKEIPRMGTDYHIRPDCRLCASPLKRSVLQLEPTPLANEFLKPGDVREELFPLYLVECLACGHVQLPIVVDPERLFRNYVYVSGTSPAFVEHFRRYAHDIFQAHKLQPGDLIVEIGSNDGTLLQHFKALGCRVLGVDPAEKIAAATCAAGIETLTYFFNFAVAEFIADAKGRAALVVANNVFAHADDLGGIVDGIKHLLRPGGAFVFEVTYLPDMLRSGTFDLCYHEHLSYHTIGPLIRFFKRRGMILTAVEPIKTHGGSIRCTARLRDPDDQYPYQPVSWILDEEQLVTPEAFAAFGQVIRERCVELSTSLRRVRMAGGRVAGYGAPAKATTLLRQFSLQGVLDYVVDDSAWKQGLCMPGTQIPVVADWSEDTDVLVVFAWNFAEPILEKLRRQGFFDGRRTAIVPLPACKEIRA